MTRLNNAEFISKVDTTLSANAGKSSIYITQKRLAASLDSAPESELDDLSSNVVNHPAKYKQNTQKCPVLIRFTTGDKSSKISTVVEPENLDSFWNEYSQALKNGFGGLKRKEKKKSKKGKVTKA